MTAAAISGSRRQARQRPPSSALPASAASAGWSFPSGSAAYAATLADNGNAISAYNSPLGYLTVTLPSTSAINAGWTIAIANDNGKLAAAQVNPTSGGHILYPGSGTARPRFPSPAGITNSRSCNSTGRIFASRS